MAAPINERHNLDRTRRVTKRAQGDRHFLPRCLQIRIRGIAARYAINIAVVGETRVLAAL